MRLGRDTDKGTGTKIEGWRTESEGRREGMAQGEPTEKNTPANKSQTLAHTRVPRAAPGNFSMAPAELEFSLIFTFSRRPPRGSAIVRTASLGTPTTITEKMQRSEPEVYLPTNLPTNQPNGAKLSIATLSNKADPSLPCGTIIAWERTRTIVAPVVPLFCGSLYVYTWVHLFSDSNAISVFDVRAMIEKKGLRNLEISQARRIACYKTRVTQYSKHNDHCKFASNLNQMIACITVALLELMYLTALSVMLKSNRDVFADEKSIERVRCYRIPCVPYM